MATQQRVLSHDHPDLTDRNWNFTNNKIMGYPENVEGMRLIRLIPMLFSVIFILFETSPSDLWT